MRTYRSSTSVERLMTFLRITIGLLAVFWLVLFFTILLPVIAVWLGLGFILLNVCNYVKYQFNFMMGK